MKKVFSHKELLLSFINAVIPDKNFVDLTFNNTQQLSDQKEFGSSVYDVYCTTSSNEEIVVEIQQIKQNNFPDRVVYYSVAPSSNCTFNQYFVGDCLDSVWPENVEGVYYDN